MLAAVKAVHDHGIVHCDLKPQNFLLFRRRILDHHGVGGDALKTAPRAQYSCFRLKLCDFGISRELKDSATHVTENLPIGTVRYMAPEVVHDSRSDGKLHVGRAADNWSIGVLLHQMLHQGLTPHSHVELHKHKLKLMLAIADENSKRVKLSCPRLLLEGTLAHDGLVGGSEESTADLDSTASQARQRMFGRHACLIGLQSACLQYRVDKRATTEDLVCMTKTEGRRFFSSCMVVADVSFHNIDEAACLRKRGRKHRMTRPRPDRPRPDRRAFAAATGTASASCGCKIFGIIGITVSVMGFLYGGFGANGPFPYVFVPEGGQPAPPPRDEEPPAILPTSFSFVTRTYPPPPTPPPPPPPSSPPTSSSLVLPSASSVPVISLSPVTSRNAAATNVLDDSGRADARAAKDVSVVDLSAHPPPSAQIAIASEGVESRSSEDELWLKKWLKNIPPAGEVRRWLLRWLFSADGVEDRAQRAQAWEDAVQQATSSSTQEVSDPGGGTFVADPGDCFDPRSQRPRLPAIARKAFQLINKFITINRQAAFFLGLPPDHFFWRVRVGVRGDDEDAFTITQRELAKLQEAFQKLSLHVLLELDNEAVEKFPHARQGRADELMPMVPFLTGGREGLATIEEKYFTPLWGPARGPEVLRHAKKLLEQELVAGRGGFNSSWERFANLANLSQEELNNTSEGFQLLARREPFRELLEDWLRACEHEIEISEQPPFVDAAFLRRRSGRRRREDTKASRAGEKAGEKYRVTEDSTEEYVGTSSHNAGGGEEDVQRVGYLEVGSSRHFQIPLRPDGNLEVAGRAQSSREHQSTTPLLQAASKAAPWQEVALLLSGATQGTKRQKPEGGFGATLRAGEKAGERNYRPTALGAAKGSAEADAGTSFHNAAGGEDQTVDDLALRPDDPGMFFLPEPCDSELDERGKRGDHSELDEESGPGDRPDHPVFPFSQEPLKKDSEFLGIGRKRARSLGSAGKGRGPRPHRAEKDESVGSSDRLGEEHRIIRFG